MSDPSIRTLLRWTLLGIAVACQCAAAVAAWS